ncbi:PLATZ transcription factor [Zostera marina]|uniref:PLATZ transcription factor n=1 Tax=Zostera marina TaxID=29655 RepID=A0A0K9P5A6_ZOSMR|nr:PLATZ transcription factor [Zostera marina]
MSFTPRLTKKRTKHVLLGLPLSIRFLLLLPLLLPLRSPDHPSNDGGEEEAAHAYTIYLLYLYGLLTMSISLLQIRRSSYHDVVRVSEIQTVLDIGGVQTYVINSARVLFLNERPQPKTAHSSAATTPTTNSSSSISGTGTGSNIIISSGGGTAHHICETCSRTLLDPLRFCSLGCKLEGIKRSGNACFVVDNLGSGSRRSCEGVEIKTRRWRRRVRLIGRSGSGGGRGNGEPTSEQTVTESTETATIAPANRRRKGTPHRSPLASS